MAKTRPFAGVSHDVIDSHAFSDLSGEAVRVLLIVARQHNGINNGELQAAHSYMKPRGVGSEHTLQKAIAQLISHGFLYRTRGRGIDPRTGENTPARYAITWASLTKNRKHLHCDDFVFNAFEKWKDEEKLGVAKSAVSSCTMCKSSKEIESTNPPAKSAVSISSKASEETAQSADIELLPVYVPPERNETPKMIRLGTYRELMSVKRSGYRNDTTHRTTSRGLSRMH